MRAWMRYIDEVPTVAVRVPSFANLFAPMRFTNTSDEDFKKHTERLPLRKQFYQRMTQKGFGKAEIDYALDQIRQTCERIEKAMDDTGGPWIMGKQYTLVDAQVTPLIDRMEDMGYGYLWEDLPKMSAWWERIKARPSYAQAFYPGARMSARYRVALQVGRGTQGRARLLRRAAFLRSRRLQVILPMPDVIRPSPPGSIILFIISQRFGTS